MTRLSVLDANLPYIISSWHGLPKRVQMKIVTFLGQDLNLNVWLFSITGLSLLSLPVVYFLFWFFDLFAKSYDYPDQQIGILLLTLFAAILSLGFGMLLNLFVRSLFVSKWNLIVLPFLIILFVAFIYCLWDVDWPSVYVAALIIPLTLVFLRDEINIKPITVISISVFVIVISLIAYSMNPTIRLSRYSKMLSACWCCDYKTRAIHELAKYGNKGGQKIAEYVKNDPIERKQVKSVIECSQDPVVRDLLHYFRQTP
jgi:hypothetical protein